MVLNTLANNKLYSNLIKILSVYNICNRQRLMNCELKLQVHQHVCLILANLSTTDSNNFPRCIYTSFYQIYDNYLPLFCYEKFPFISVFIFFYHTHSKRDKKILATQVHDFTDFGLMQRLFPFIDRPIISHWSDQSGTALLNVIFIYIMDFCMFIFELTFFQ